MPLDSKCLLLPRKDPHTRENRLQGVFLTQKVTILRPHTPCAGSCIPGQLEDVSFFSKSKPWSANPHHTVPGTPHTQPYGSISLRIIIIIPALHIRYRVCKNYARRRKRVSNHPGADLFPMPDHIVSCRSYYDVYHQFSRRFGIWLGYILFILPVCPLKFYLFCFLYLYNMRLFNYLSAHACTVCTVSSLTELSGPKMISCMLFSFLFCMFCVSENTNK